MLASQVRDRPSDEESIEILIRGSQPSIGGLLSIQPLTTFASLVRVGARIENSIRSGRYPTISASARQDIAPNNCNNNHSGSNNNGNKHPRRREHSKPIVAFIDSSATQFNLEDQPVPNQVVYAPAPTHTPQITHTAQPVYLATSARQEQRPPQRRPLGNAHQFTMLVEPLSSVLPKVASLLKFPEVRLLPNPLPSWYKVGLYCNYHRAEGHSTDNCFTLRGAIQDLIDRKVIAINTQEAASTFAPPLASTLASALAPPHPSIMHQPLPEHSGSRGTGTSGVHSIFLFGPTTSVVDPSTLIHLASDPFLVSLYNSALTGSESAIFMIRLDAEPRHSADQPTMQQLVEPPIYLLAAPRPEPFQPSSRPTRPANLANPSPTPWSLRLAYPWSLI